MKIPGHPPELNGARDGRQSGGSTQRLRAGYRRRKRLVRGMVGRECRFIFTTREGLPRSVWLPKEAGEMCRQWQLTELVLAACSSNMHAW